MRNFIRLFMMVGLLNIAYGCSSDENLEMNDTKFEEFIMDNNIDEKWDGTGLPSWFQNRIFNYVLKETRWLAESYWGTTLYNAYKLKYKDNLLLVLNYDRFGCRATYYNESGVICFTNDGRKVNYDEIKSNLEGEAELVWTNELGSKEYTIKVTDAELANVNRLGWLQKVVDQVCQNIKEPEQVLCELAFGYAYDDTDTYVVVDYKYFDKNNLENGEIGVCNVYTMDGKTIETGKKLQTKELCRHNLADVVYEN